MKYLIVFILVLVQCAGNSQSFYRAYQTGWFGDFDDNVQIECDSGEVFYLGINGTSLVESPDFKILKLNSVGDTLWAKKIGYWNDDESFRAMLLNSASELVCTGNFVDGTAPITSYDVFVMCLDANGSILWETVFDVQGSDHVSSIAQTADGGYVVMGTSAGTGALFVAKLDALGQVSWVKQYSGLGFYYEWDGKIITGSGGDFFYTVSAYDSTGVTSSVVGRIDSSGNIIWQNKYSEGSYFSACSIAELSNGDLVLATRDDYSNWTLKCFSVMRLTPGGNMLWSKVYVWATSHDLFAEEIRIGPGDEINIGGTVIIPATSEQTGFITRMTGSGTVISTRTYDLNMRSAFNDFELLPGGGFVAAGYLDSSGWQIGNLLRTDAVGNLNCGYGSYNLFVYNLNVQVSPVASTVNSGYIVFPIAFISSWLYTNYWYDCPVGITDAKPDLRNVYFDGESMHIENCLADEFCLYDVQGRIVLRQKMPSQNYEMKLDDCAAGVYCYLITSKEGVVTKTGRIAKSD